VSDGPVYFRTQAQRHRQLALETMDAETAKALRMIAEEYDFMATELEAKTGLLIAEIKPEQG
jgi:hypothetical protein